ncbi:MAG: hypothetical protein ACF8MJ_00605, partial [Phycisphaerales bacterium JB050]
AAVQGGLPYIPTGSATGIPTTPGVTESAISDCATLQGLAPRLGYGYSDGVPTSVKGNPLPNSPEFTVSLGADERHRRAMEARAPLSLARGEETLR